jgi:hypothetical protein
MRSLILPPGIVPRETPRSTMNTKSIARPYRKQIKRARRKLASAQRAADRAENPRIGAESSATRAVRRATMEYRKAVIRWVDGAPW